VSRVLPSDSVYGIMFLDIAGAKQSDTDGGALASCGGVGALPHPRCRARSVSVCIGCGGIGRKAEGHFRHFTYQPVGKLIEYPNRLDRRP